MYELPVDSFLSTIEFGKSVENKKLKWKTLDQQLRKNVDSIHQSFLRTAQHLIRNMSNEHMDAQK